MAKFMIIFFKSLSYYLSIFVKLIIAKGCVYFLQYIFCMLLIVLNLTTH